MLIGPISTWEKLGLRATFECYKILTSLCFSVGFYNCNLTRSLGPNGFKSWVPNPKCSSIQAFRVLMMSRVAKALLRHPCSVLLLSFGLLMSFIGVHVSRRQRIQKTVGVCTLGMTISALPYSLGCIPGSQEGSPTMMMKALPPDNGLCSNSFSNLSST